MVVVIWCIKIKGSLFTAIFNPLMLVMVALVDHTMLNKKLHLRRLPNFSKSPKILGVFIGSGRPDQPGDPIQSNPDFDPNQTSSGPTRTNPTKPDSDRFGQGQPRVALLTNAYAPGLRAPRSADHYLGCRRLPPPHPLLRAGLGCCFSSYDWIFCNNLLALLSHVHQ
ncbi:hypothetical protein Fmac_018486 [Flemingia macrophylla]|uniref:Uncharacterized protein n=1 Tax=Flemingia macrophylla TaxID=520843 RepID=A0ABD1M738_9FABA